MTTPTVLLFDIDGTLLSSSGAGRRAMERAFREVARGDGSLHFGFDGMTDRAIVRRGLTELTPAPAPEEKLIDAVLDAYVDILVEELAAPGDYRVYPGVRAVLEAAARTPRAALGLGTGNIRRGAALKLGRVGLDGYFAFGGFGCDAEDRPSILRIGAERGAAELGVARGVCRVVVVGDTPRDVSAARAIGAECVGVGTGRYGAGELREAGATSAYDDLEADGAAAAILEGH